jgi:Glu-tRNA(Gln) amidotransferase subunit E-like FAD-binding protein
MVITMATPTKPDVKANLKEATDLLDCMNVNDEKLQKIIAIISEKIKDDPNIKKIIETLCTSYNEEDNLQVFPALQKLLEHDEIIPLIEQILSGLGNNPDVIENIEKKVLPILFSR